MTLWSISYSLVRVSVIKIGLVVSTIYNFVLVMDVITKQALKMYGKWFHLNQFQSNKLPQLLMIKHSTTMDLLTEPSRSLTENSKESKNFQFRDGLN